MGFPYISLHNLWWDFSIPLPDTRYINTTIIVSYHLPSLIIISLLVDLILSQRIQRAVFISQAVGVFVFIIHVLILYKYPLFNNSFPLFVTTYSLLLITVFCIFGVPVIQTIKKIFGDIYFWMRSIHIDTIKIKSNKKNTLYLRSFKLDEHVVSEFKPFFTRFLPAPSIKNTLELTIVKSVYNYSALIAVGNPNDTLPPLGAIREYLSEEDWRPFVMTEIGAAERILFQCGPSQHTKWESEQIISTKSVEKLVLVFPAEPNIALEYFYSNKELFKYYSDVNIIEKLLKSGELRCLYFSKNGPVLVKNKFKSDFDYLLALDHAMAQ
jgi:hypothetical protein